MTTWINKVDIALRYLLIALAVTMTATVTWQVISRYALQSPSSLTEEIARFQLIWLGLLGAVYAFRNRAHVRIDILLVSLGGRRRIAAEIFVLLSCMVFAVVVLVYGGTQLVALTFELQQTSAALGIKVAYVYAIVPFSGILISVYCGYFIAELLQHGTIPPASGRSSSGTDGHV